MYDVIINNYGYWVNLIIPLVIGVYFLITHKEVVWKEFLMQIGLTGVLVTGTYFLLFSTTTDLMDKEYWNNKVSSFVYYEEWKEKVTYTEEQCSGSGDKRTCRTVTKTRIDYHPPYWEIITTGNETVSISKSNYRIAENKYKSNEVKLFRTNQVSWGDGNKFVSTPNEILPTAVGHTYTNFVVAAKHNIIHNKFSEETILENIKNNSLQEYPKEISDSMGVPQIKRVINTTNINLTHSLEKELNFMANRIGKNKESNPIIYLTNKDRDFAFMLEYHWNKAKKNDVILVLGLDDKGLIKWTEVLCWTKNTDIYVDGSKWFTNNELNLIKDEKTVLTLFEKLINEKYVRKPMEEFKYLAENITLDWYWQLLIIILNIVGSFFLIRYFTLNRIR